MFRTAAAVQTQADRAASRADEASHASGDERQLFWFTQAVILPLVTLGVATVFSSLTTPDLPAGSLPWLILVRMCTIFGATLFLRSIYRLPRIERLDGGWLVATVVAACLTAALLELAGFQLIAVWLMPVALAAVERYPSFAVMARFIICLFWSATYLLLRQRATSLRNAAAAATAKLRATKAEVALRESELERLGQHVEPHFLFNALSAVLACRHDPDAVEAVTTALSDYLRFCLARGKEPEPLAHELDATEQLLSVHEARFGDDLRCSVGASPAARRIAVPPMVLAPLVDNALKFASQTCHPPWEIAVTARVADHRLVITVSNSGRWAAADSTRQGTGLANLRRRLELSGVDHQLDLREEGGTVTATLSLPAAQATTAA